MKKIFILSLSFLLIFTVLGKMSSLHANPITITILYDNYLFSEGTKTDWGFSCIIEGIKKTILFDTGAKSEIFFFNLNKLNVDPKKVEFVVISHNHGDHTGGLFSFLNENNEVSVYLPQSFPDSFVKRVEDAKAKVVSVDKPVEICKDVYLTGEMGIQIKEQSLILNTNRGLVVITGCAHPGIVNIVRRAKEVLDKDIYLVFGGFHLLRLPDNSIKEIIEQFKEMGVLKVGATHCTGDRAVELFKEAYGENYVKMGVGRVISISD